MRKAIAIGITAATLFAFSLEADCPAIFSPDDPPCVELHYYATLNVEPNWCNYSPGDTVYIQVGNGGVTTAWYIIPASDTASAPPSGFSTAYYGVINADCTITWYIRV